MADIQAKSSRTSSQESREENSHYLQLVTLFKNEVKNVTPQMEKALARITATRTPEGLFEAKNELLIGCFHNAGKIRQVVLKALQLTAEFLDKEETHAKAPLRPIAIHHAMQEEGNVFSVHRLIQTSATPDLDCLIALQLAVEKHDEAFINSVLFPESSGRLPHLKIDSRNRIGVALQFAVEKGDMAMTSHILTKLPVANRGLFYSMALYEAAHTENEVMVAMLLSQKALLKIEDEAITHMITMSQKMGTHQIVSKLVK